MMGKQKSNNKQTVKQETQLPSWYTNSAKGAIAFADDAAANMMKPFQGNAVAGLDPLTSQAINLTGQNIGSTNAAFGQAGQTAANVGNFQPGSFLNGNVAAYMNPYIQNVENAALGNMDRSFRQNLNTIADGAISAGAFGGSRQGVAEGVAAAENARQMSDLSAQLRSQGFTQASGLMQSDMDRQMAGQELNLRAAGAQGDLAAAGQQSYLQSIQAALAGGQINQAQAQALLTQQQQQYEAMRQMPAEQLNLRLAALGGVQLPTSMTQVSKTPTSGSSLGSALGGALSGAASGATIGSVIPGIGTAAGAIGGAVIGGLGGLSDERMKTNVEPLGRDAITGLPIYAYDYKSDVKQARDSGAPMPPKRVGPMAQDIEKVDPRRVANVGGKKVVRNFGFGGA